MDSTPFPLPASLPSTETLFYPASTPTSSSKPTSEPDTFLLFLPGNPGLIEYYRVFLSTLFELLNQQISILGVAHAGFDTRQTAARAEAPWYWTLAEQIEQKVEIIDWLSSREWEKEDNGTQTGEVNGIDGENVNRVKGEEIQITNGEKRGMRIIIVGHSVGGYISMEVLRILGERRKKGIVKTDEGIEILGGVLLFPTIMEIAKSSSGRLLSRILNTIPLLPLSSTLTLLPTRLIHLLITTITHQPPTASATTLQLFTTPGTLFQALSMAKDEMAEITTDRWNTDIWGSEKAGVSRLVFYFAKKDHWVADVTRDAIIKNRGRGLGEDWKPKMFVCEDGFPHTFCVNHGEQMAGKVARWVEEMLGV